MTAAQGSGPVREHAVLEVRPGQNEQFEDAFAQALPIISASPGFISLVLDHCLERPDVYLLLVDWESLEAHTVGFRQSPAYDHWRALLHHFYDPMPLVEHFAPVHRSPAHASPAQP